MDTPDVFIVEWGSILRDLEAARPDVPLTLIDASVKLPGGGYSMSNPRSVAVVAAQKFANDRDMPRGRNSTVIPEADRKAFWDFIAAALADALVTWDRHLTTQALDWAHGHSSD